MGLFSQESAGDGSLVNDAPRRMAWTRELGTRKLVIGFVAILAVWYGVNQIRDHFLLQKHWEGLKPVPNGLTIVGTLDARDSYDRNMFRIIQANKSSRAELTDFGWRTIFDSKNGPMFTDSAGNAIQYAIGMDDATGYAMLEPYLRAGVAKLMRRPDWTSIVSKDYPITVQEGKRSSQITTQKTLGMLLDQFTMEARGARETKESDTSEGGSASGREVEHGLTIPGDTLIQVCPVVLTGAQFTGGWVEEHPPSVMVGRTYTVHLYLNDEGRSRFFQWTHDHVNEDLVLVLNHEVQAAGRIKMALNEMDWEIGPLRDPEAANNLVRYVNSGHNESK